MVYIWCSTASLTFPENKVCNALFFFFSFFFLLSKLRSVISLCLRAFNVTKNLMFHGIRWFGLNHFLARVVKRVYVVRGKELFVQVYFIQVNIFIESLSRVEVFRNPNSMAKISRDYLRLRIYMLPLHCDNGSACNAFVQCACL